MAGSLAPPTDAGRVRAADRSGAWLGVHWLRGRGGLGGDAMVVLVRTLAGARPVRLDIEPAEGGTLADVAEAIESLLHLAQAEQLYIARGRKLEPCDRLADLAEGASHQVVVHLVRRPDPGRSISFNLKVAGAARAHRVTVRAAATVCEVKAAALASLHREEAARYRGSSLQLMLGGVVLDQTPGLIAVEFGLDDDCSLLVVPSRYERPSVGTIFSVQVKILGIPAVQVSAASGWQIRQLKGVLQSVVLGHWQACSALCRRCDTLDLSSSEVHFLASHGQSTRRLRDDDKLPQPGASSVYFILPSEMSLDAGARLLLARVVPQDASGSAEVRAERIRTALLESAAAELRLQLAAQAAHPDCKTVNGKRKQRSVKRSHSRRGAYICRGHACRRAESNCVPLVAPRGSES